VLLIILLGYGIIAVPRHLIRQTFINKLKALETHREALLLPCAGNRQETPGTAQTAQQAGFARETLLRLIKEQ